MKRTIGSRRIVRQDFTPLRLAENRRLASRAFADMKLADPSATWASAEPPGLLDQDAAADARLWFERVATRALRRHERDLRRRGLSSWKVFLTVIPPSGAVTAEELWAFDVGKLRDKMQRYARSLPAQSFFAGMLEADWVVDQCAGVRAWIWHGHFIVVIPAPSAYEACKLARKAFPVRADPNLGIVRPVKAQWAAASRGGYRGVIRYASKALQIHGVHRKSITLNAKTGGRGQAQKQTLTRKELAVWASFASRTSPESLMVWSGYRKYGTRLVRTSRH